MSMNDKNIDFLGKRKIAAVMSTTLLVISIVSFFVRGFNLGLDFSGGTLIEVGYPQAVQLDGIRSSLEKAGFSEAVVQHFGTASDVLIKVAPRKSMSSAQLSNEILNDLKQSNAGVEIRRVEYVGPQVGDQLREDGGLALIFALLGILLYVTLRFEYRFSLGAVLALVHDVTITMGLFSVFQLEFDLTVLAAVLAVIGYSLNDTIVVFDRIRENFRRIRKSSTVEIINTSLNQTLSRTLMTSFTTLLVVIALFFFGGELIHGFATALMCGIIVGTYSSIYVASALAIALGVSKSDLMPVEKEGANQDRP